MPDSHAKLKKVNQIARRKGLSVKIQKSSRMDKKFMVCYRGKVIHFGSSGYQDYLDHGDAKRRIKYLARARGIRDGQGKLTHKNKNKANFWAINLLW